MPLNTKHQNVYIKIYQLLWSFVHNFWLDFSAFLSFLLCCVENALSFFCTFKFGKKESPHCVLTISFALSWKVSSSFLILSWKMTLYYLHIGASIPPSCLLCPLFNPSLRRSLPLAFVLHGHVYSQWFGHCNDLQYKKGRNGKTV